MIQDITREEVYWRFEILKNAVEDLFEDVPYELQEADKGIHGLESLVCGALVYLESCGAIEIMLHKTPHYEGALFTATRHQCTKAAYEKVSEIYEYDKPSKRDIPVPVLFEDEKYKNFTHVSLIFKYPDTELGRFCERMIGYLCQVCKKDVAVVNMVIFMHIYFSGVLYFGGMRRALFDAFVYDKWKSALQTPPEVETIMKELLVDEPDKLYDPFMRTGYNYFFSGESYHAQADSEYFRYATMLFCGISKKDADNIVLEDCTTNWDPRDCDVIIASPEFGQEVNLGEDCSEPISTWLLQKMQTSLKYPGRKALLLLPSSILTSTGKAEWLRRDLIVDNLVDTVVLLPANIFPKTGISTTLILLQEGREKDAPVRFIDLSAALKDESDWEDENKPQMDEDLASNAIRKKDPKMYCEVSCKDIEAHDYEWYAPKYISKEQDVPNGYRRIRIADLLQPIYIFEWGSSIQNYVLTDNELESNPFKEYLALDNLSASEFSDKHNDSEYAFLSCSCFVIDYQDGFKTYYYEPTELSFANFAMPNYCNAYRVNPDEIDIDYLRLMLHDIGANIKENTKEKIDDHKFLSQVLYTELVLPLSLEEQRKAYQAAKLNAAVEKARKEGLEEAINQMKEEYMMEVRMRKHDMKPCLSRLDSQAKLISIYMNQIEGNDDIVASIRQKLDGISNAVSELRRHLARLTEEDIYGKPEPTNPLNVLRELCGTFNNYSVMLEIDEIALKEAGIDEPCVHISPVDFSTLSSTIIENAVTHAFIDAKETYHVHLFFSFNKDKNTFIIDFRNDGAAMPVGMDKFRYGLKGEKGAKSRGTGLGGYRVKSITRHYGGDYDVFCNRTQKFTTIRVELPKYAYDEKV